MKILVLNCGSSSIKYKLIDMPKNDTLASGGVEKIGLKDSFLKYKTPSGEKKQIDCEIPEHTAGIELILKVLQSKEDGAIKNLSEIEAVGHRVVHGGEKFNKSVLITKDVIDNIKACAPLAPLHNPANLKGIEAVTAELPNVPQVAVFDTAFHQTMPAAAYMYALPYEYYKNDGVRRYGFHGTSHRYVSARTLEILGMKPEGTKMITCHIGNGGSISAIKDGKSVDTSMGLTPLEGLVMGTRCGDIDTGAITYLMERNKLDIPAITNILNKESGLKGVSGISQDMRDVEAGIQNGNERATLARDMFVYRVRKFIGSYTAVLGGLDILVFTGGIGENQATIRELCCKDFGYLGVEIDAAANKAAGGVEKVISTPSSKVKVLVVPTDEEYMIAKDTLDLVK